MHTFVRLFCYACFTLKMFCLFFFSLFLNSLHNLDSHDQVAAQSLHNKEEKISVADLKPPKKVIMLLYHHHIISPVSAELSVYSQTTQAGIA